MDIDQTVIMLERHVGYVRASVWRRRWLPGRRSPQSLNRPWQQSFVISGDLTDSEIYASVITCVRRLAGLLPAEPAEPASGAPGGGGGETSRPPGQGVLF